MDVSADWAGCIGAGGRSATDGFLSMSHRKISTTHRVAFVGNSIPRRCGIATFTSGLRDAFTQRYRHVENFIVPVTDTEEGYDYPPEVWFEIAEKEVSSYRRAADFLSISDVGVVCLQHEFGIFGGPAGSHVLALLRDLRTPIVTTLHTILRDPDPSQRAVMDELGELSSRFVVMTQRGAELLQEVYGFARDRISIIPHGIPQVTFITRSSSDIGLANVRPVRPTYLHDHEALAGRALDTVYRHSRSN